MSSSKLINDSSGQAAETRWSDCSDICDLTVKKAFTNIDELWEILSPGSGTGIQGKEAFPDDIE
jgi:hypothetical protein